MLKVFPSVKHWIKIYWYSHYVYLAFSWLDKLQVCVCVVLIIIFYMESRYFNNIFFFFKTQIYVSPCITYIQKFYQLKQSCTVQCNDFDYFPFLWNKKFTTHHFIVTFSMLFNLEHVACIYILERKFLA